MDHGFGVCIFYGDGNAGVRPGFGCTEFCLVFWCCVINAVCAGYNLCKVGYCRTVCIY